MTITVIAIAALIISGTIYLVTLIFGILTLVIPIFGMIFSGFKHQYLKKT